MALYINRSTIHETTERDGDEEELDLSGRHRVGSTGRTPQHLEAAIEESE
jgi:hypothetical protein